jgi:hypothetical protein
VGVRRERCRRRVRRWRLWRAWQRWWSGRWGRQRCET